MRERSSFLQASYGEDILAVKIMKEDRDSNMLALYQKISSEIAWFVKMILFLDCEEILV
jgi:hypothetical protein